MEKEIQRILDEHCDWTPKRIEGLKKELLNLFIVSQQRELLQCFCKLTNITHDTVNKDIEDAIHSFNVNVKFEAKDKIIDLTGYVTEIKEVDGDVVWFYDQNGEYMSLRKEYVKRYSS